MDNAAFLGAVVLIAWGCVMNDNAFLAALGLTLFGAGGVVAVLHWPLRRILAHCCHNDDLTAVWVRMGELLLVLIPLTLLVFGGAVEHQPHHPFLYQAVEYSKWSLVGLVGAIFVVAAMIGGLVRPLMSSIWVAPHQVNDLERLIAKVEQIRARELIRRVADPSRS